MTKDNSQCCTEDSSFLRSMVQAGVYSSIMEKPGLITIKSSLKTNEETLKWCCLIVQPSVKVNFVILKSFVVHMTCIFFYFCNVRQPISFQIQQ